MADGGQPRARLDELAREHALRYAACTMCFIRSATVDWDYVDFTEAPFRQQLVTYHSHPGKPPMFIDAWAQHHFEATVQEQRPAPKFGDVLILGEEASHRDWDPSRPGATTIFRCDPVDGTSALAHSGEGFATVVTVEYRRDSGHDWRHLGGAIVRGDGRSVSWSRSSVIADDLLFDLNREPNPTDRPNLTGNRGIPPFASRNIDPMHRRFWARSGAAVAAQSAKRRELLWARYAQLILEAEYFDNKAGCPSVWPLCHGLLGFVIEPNSTTIHDSVYLWPFVLLGGHVVDHNYQPVNVLDLIEEHAGPESMEKVFPPHIAYVHEESLEFIKSTVPE
jgi:hypothetical protein